MNRLSYPTRLQMPLLLMVGMAFSGFFTAIAALVIPLMALSMLFSSHFTDSDGRSVTRAEFFADAWPLMLGMTAITAIMGLIAYGLWKERPWSRDFIMAYWLVTGGIVVSTQFVSPQPLGEFLSGMFGVVVLAVIALWYLYGSEGVQAYYRAVASKAALQSGQELTP